jgi:fucose permease
MKPDSRLLVIVAFVSFIALGLPDGSLGVAWPSMSSTFGVRLGSLGVLLGGFTVGYVVTTALIGVLITRFGFGTVMTASAAFLTFGTAGIVLFPAWTAAILCMVCLGTGSGLLDGGLNAYGAAHFRPRDLNWLHAFYGIGAALGPAIMTPMIVTGRGWQKGYIVLAAVSAVITILFVTVRSRWKSTPADMPPAHSGVSGGGGRLGLIGAGSVLLFFLYTGLEVVAGQWAFTYFTLDRGFDAATAGSWVGMYWAALTTGRILFGFVSERLAPTVILRGTMATAGIGIAFLLIPGGRNVAGPVGLGLLGFSLAPMFPLLIGETPRRIGSARANHLIGFQIAAANIGAVTLVSLVGVGIERIGTGIVPWALAGSFVAFVALHEVLLLVSSPRVSSPQDAAEDV